MKFSSIDNSADGLAIRFRESLTTLSRASGFTLTKIDECPYQVLIALAPINSHVAGEVDSVNPLEYQQKRGHFTNHIYQQKLFRREIDHPLGEIIPYPFINPNLEIIRIGKRKFILSLSKPEEKGNSLVALQIIANIWQLDQGRIPMHTAGILHKGGLYLFSGPSGAGKSTISFFSLSIGDKVVDEDQLVVYKSQGKKYSANAWGKNYGKFQAPIRGFFWLVKSESDRLLPLSSKQASKEIWEQSLQALGGILPEGNRKPLFTRINEFVGTIPTFELQFRQSSDFWQLIDAQIPFD